MIQIKWLKNKIPIYHNTGDDPCCKIALYSLVELTDGLLIKAKFFELPNGDHPMDGDEIRCGSCKMLLPNFNAYNVKEERNTCPECKGILTMITNDRMDETSELIASCKFCKICFRDEKLGWRILD